jgi:hypothetical protein
MNKLDEIRWRIENRTAMYHGAGCTNDSSAHDDILWLLEQLEGRLSMEQQVNDSVRSMVLSLVNVT